MISTKGRYAVRVLVDLVEQGDNGFVPLKEIALRQGISEKYLQHVIKLLVQAGMVTGSSGKGGGYQLSCKPEDLSVFEVLEAAEGTLAPVACLAPNAAACDRAPQCKTLPMWQRYYETTRSFFEDISIADVASGKAWK